MRHSRIILGVVATMACAGSSVPAKLAVPVRGIALDSLTFPIVLDSLIAELRRERPISPMVILAPVKDSIPSGDLDANLAATDDSVHTHRAQLLRRLDLRTAASLSWFGCSSFKLIGGDHSKCPANDEVTVAIGKPRSSRPEEAVMAGGEPVPGNSIVVRSISTIRSPGGAHSRVKDFIFVMDGRIPRVRGRRFVVYFE